MSYYDRIVHDDDTFQHKLIIPVNAFNLLADRHNPLQGLETSTRNQDSTILVCDVVLSILIR
jgi:hypothetical protein